MMKYLYECLGVMLIIIIGNGAVCNVSLNKSGMKNSGALMVNIAWGLGVMIPCFIFGSYSGAVFNPAVALALAIDGSLEWQAVPGYIVAEFVGAMIGQALVYLMYYNHFKETEDSDIIFGCFATSPSIKSYPCNLLTEVIATFIMMFSIKGISNVVDLAQGLNNVYVAGIISAIGMSLGGLTGYALNPARDLGPRLLYTLLPIKNKKTGIWSYSFVPLVGPIIGAILGVLLYMLIF